MSLIKFSKYQGLGNDFIIVDRLTNNSNSDLGISDLQLAKFICRRNFGIGADGIIFAEKSSNGCDLKMKIINSDGTEPEMCGNGIRCLIKYLIDSEKGYFTNNKIFSVETLAGTIKVEHEADGNITVDMGKPILDPKNIPTRLEVIDKGVPSKNIILNNKEYTIYAVGMGNPHLIFYTDKLSKIPLLSWGPLLENNEFFPAKTNVHFVEVINQKLLNMLVWERGCGRTLACGTGACAVAVCSILTNKCDNNVDINLEGGNLNIQWSNLNSSVYMKGPAQFVYSGLFETNNI